MKEDVLLQMHNVTKTFPGVKALDNMSIDIRTGTVHALMGENGAGKSTLMKILSGLFNMDSGEIFFNGERLETKSIADILKHGITMIYQELNPIDTLTVAENIFCGKIPCKLDKLYIDRKSMNMSAQALLDKLEVNNIMANQRVRELSIAQKQLLEITKAMANDSKLIIMDEPTSAITEDECQRLFRTIKRLKKDGMTFIYISHKLDEVFEIADEVTVMRDGKLIGSKKIEEISRDEIVTMMVGRELKQLFPKEKVEIGEIALEVKNLSSKNVFNNVSFDLKKGEILGFAGLMGAGRTEVMESIFGLRKVSSGEIFLDGEKINISAPRMAINRRMAFITEDRKKTGCFMSAPVYLNTMVLSWKRFRVGPWIRHKLGRKVCVDQLERFNVKTTGPSQEMGNLSGGNQQKVLLARWLLPEPEIIIMDEPTRGIDVGSKHEIYQKMTTLVKQGKSIIMISSELPEILGMSDRVVVMHEGHLTGILDRKEVDQEKILRLASGLA